MGCGMTKRASTLIELLVVVIIIGILVTTAIPPLNQRKKGWESVVKSDLRNYAIVMEMHLTDPGAYNAAGLAPPVESTNVDLRWPPRHPTPTAAARQAQRGRLEPDAGWRPGQGGVLRIDVASW